MYREIKRDVVQVLEKDFVTLPSVNTKPLAKVDRMINARLLHGAEPKAFTYKETN